MLEILVFQIQIRTSWIRIPVSQRYGSENPDPHPDPCQNVTDPEQRNTVQFNPLFATNLPETRSQIERRRPNLKSAPLRMRLARKIGSQNETFIRSQTLGRVLKQTFMYVNSLILPPYWCSRASLNSSFWCLILSRCKQCCGSGMFIPDPTFFPSRIPDPNCLPPESRILKEFKYFNPQKSKKKWFLSSQKYDPGCSSWIPDTDADFLPSRIPGSKRQPIPDPGSGSATLDARRYPTQKLEVQTWNLLHCAWGWRCRCDAL